MLLLQREVQGPISHYSSSHVVIAEGSPGAHIPLQLLPCCYWGGRSRGPYPTTALLLLLFGREVLVPISHYSSYPVVIEEGGPGAHIPLQLFSCCYLRRKVQGPISHYSPSLVVIEEGGPGAHIPLHLFPCCYWGGRYWGPYPTTALLLLSLRREVLRPISHYSSSLVVIEEGGPEAHIPLQLFPCCYWGGRSWGPYPTTALPLLLLRREVLRPISHYSSSLVVIEEGGPGAHIPLQLFPCVIEEGGTGAHIPLQLFPCCYWGGRSCGPYPTTALLLLLFGRVVQGPISHYNSSAVVIEEGGPEAHIPLQLLPCCYWGGRSRGPSPTTALLLLLLRRWNREFDFILTLSYFNYMLRSDIILTLTVWGSSLDVRIWRL